MHKLVIAIWHVLAEKVVHRGLGADYFTRKDPPISSAVAWSSARGPWAARRPPEAASTRSCEGANHPG